MQINPQFPRLWPQFISLHGNRQKLLRLVSEIRTQPHSMFAFPSNTGGVLCCMFRLLLFYIFFCSVIKLAVCSIFVLRDFIKASTDVEHAANFITLSCMFSSEQRFLHQGNRQQSLIDLNTRFVCAWILSNVCSVRWDPSIWRCSTIAKRFRQCWTTKDRQWRPRLHIHWKWYDSFSVPA